MYLSENLLYSGANYIPKAFLCKNLIMISTKLIIFFKIARTCLLS